MCSKRYKMTLAYDGASYIGWQIQPKGASVQGEIQKVLSRILQEEITITGSGRTDKGVHARGQVAHFECAKTIEISELKTSLNALLPNTIRVNTLDLASTDFHARYSASGKIYHYHIHLGEVSDPFLSPYSLHIRPPLNLKAMQGATHVLIGTHDFCSFANHGSDTKDTIRTIKRIDIFTYGKNIRVEFEGDGFLYKMVRNLMGALLDVGTGDLTREEIKAILRAKDRRCAPKSAPAHALFLSEVLYL